jgi:hypothetical protein
MTDKFISHREKRIIELHKRMKKSKLHTSKRNKS